MSPDIIRIVVAAAVLGHGIGHVLFMPLLSSAMRLEASGHSWLFTSTIGDGPAKLLATVVAAGMMVAFLLVAGGIAWQTTWWRQIAIGAAVASILLVVAMWDGLPTGPASAAIAFDLVMLAALLVVHWPSRELIGA